MKPINFLTTTLLMLVIFVGLTKFVFNISGLKFYLELLILLGLILFGLMAMVLIYNRVKFGYAIYAFVAAIALLNFIIIYARTRQMTSLMFVSIIASMTAFVLGVISIGDRSKKKVVLSTYETPEKTVKKTARKKARKKAKKKSTSKRKK